MALIDPGKKAPAFSLPDQAGTNALSRRLRGPARRPLLLPEGRHAWLHQGVVRFPGQSAKVQEEQGGSARRQRAQLGQQGKFADKYGLKFPLLADEDHSVMEKFGVWQEKSMYGKKYMGVARTTYLIGPDGKVAKRWDGVKVDGHAEEVLAAVQAL